MSVRLTAADAVEVRTGGVVAEHGRAVLCAGRGTVALARGAGVPLPVRQAAHVRLTYRLRGEPPARLPCLLDGSGAFGEPAYGDPLPGNDRFAIGLGETPVHEDGSLVDTVALSEATDRTTAYVAGALPGLEPGKRSGHVRSGCDVDSDSATVSDQAPVLVYRGLTQPGRRWSLPGSGSP